MSSNKTDYEIALIGLPVIGSFLLLVWVSSLSVLDGRFGSLQLVSALVVAGTALLAALESSANTPTPINNKKFVSPLFWFFSILNFMDCVLSNLLKRQKRIRFEEFFILYWLCNIVNYIRNISVCATWVIYIQYCKLAFY